MQTKLSEEEQKNYIFKINDVVKCINVPISNNGNLKKGLLYKICGFNILNSLKSYEVFVEEIDSGILIISRSYLQSRFESTQKNIIEKL